MQIKAEHISLVDIDSLTPNPNNRNKHSQEQIERLCKIIKENGFRQPLLVSQQTGFIVAGHGRLEAAKKLGLKKVPVMFQEFATPEQEYAVGVSDNAIASWAELDLSGINMDLAGLGPDFDLDLLGIEHFKLEALASLDPAIKQLNEEREKKHILQVQFPNDMEMMDAHDDLMAKGYMVKVL